MLFRSTAYEFAETLEPAAVMAVLEQAPGWAEAAWSRQVGLSDGEKARLLNRV